MERGSCRRLGASGQWGLFREGASAGGFCPLCSEAGPRRTPHLGRCWVGWRKSQHFPLGGAGPGENHVWPCFGEPSLWAARGLRWPPAVSSFMRTQLFCLFTRGLAAQCYGRTASLCREDLLDLNTRTFPPLLSSPGQREGPAGCLVEGHGVHVPGCGVDVRPLLSLDGPSAGRLLPFVMNQAHLPPPCTCGFRLLPNPLVTVGASNVRAEVTRCPGRPVRFLGLDSYRFSSWSHQGTNRLSCVRRACGCWTGGAPVRTLRGREGCSAPPCPSPGTPYVLPLPARATPPPRAPPWTRHAPSMAPPSSGPCPTHLPGSRPRPHPLRCPVTPLAAPARTPAPAPAHSFGDLPGFW